MPDTFGPPPILPVVCCQYLLAKGLSEEGIFRIPASQTEIKRLLAEFNAGQVSV